MCTAVGSCFTATTDDAMVTVGGALVGGAN
jgi:hypothetical protein